MSRDKITEDFGHEPKDKVTWGDERRQGGRAAAADAEARFRDARDPRAENEASGGCEYLCASRHWAGMSVRPAPRSSRDSRSKPRRRFEQLRIEPLGATVEASAAPQAHPAPAAPPQGEAPRPSDNWRQYEVRKQPTDWKNYEILGQQPGQQASQPPSARRVEDVDVESALSSLKEVTGAADSMQPRRDMSQMPQQASHQAPQQGPPQGPPRQQAPAQPHVRRLLRRPPPSLPAPMRIPTRRGRWTISGET